MLARRFGFPAILLFTSAALGCVVDSDAPADDEGGGEQVASAAAELSGVRRPVALWNLDECLNGTQYLGTSSHNGTACAKGQFGAAASFDGVDDRIELPDATAYHFTTAMTVSAWVRPSRVSGAATIINKWYSPDAYSLGILDGEFNFSVAFPDGSLDGASYMVSAPAQAGVWTHLTGVFDGWTIRLYVNGALAKSLAVQPAGSPARSLQQSSRPLVLGNHPSWNAYAGLIDDVSLYDVALSSSEVSALASPAPAQKAIILVDHRLYPLVAAKLDEYRHLAENDRGFRVALHVVKDLDDWTPAQTRSYISSHYTTWTPGLEGALFVGNVKLPSFYKSRDDITNTRYVPRYFEDLDGVFSKNYADGATDPLCPTNAPLCAWNGPLTVPVHDFDYTEKGPNPYPEIWAAFMPVGTATDNTYAAFAGQLNPYLDKVIKFHKGQVVTNGKYYFVSNDKGENFEKTWESWSRDRIDFYGMPGPNNETGSACLTPGGNVCYQRWPMQSYATVNDFFAAYAARPWVDEGWQDQGIFMGHMNGAMYDVAEINVHSWEGGSLIDAWQARQLTQAAALVALDGCSVLGFAQPGGRNVDTSIAVADNIAMAYLYGSSKAVAAMGDPFWRGHYAHHPTIFRELKVNGSYLGAAHLVRMKRLYDSAGTSPWELREHGMEMLVGDPFLDFTP
ncbi:LamG domain-containing protein [Sorangium sp. So ce131]|uniref:LamG domain-containing protein n=1 Tax=Sorangium sp. So ce131 TaxID=3133282 RepID=UPI003F61F8DA